MAKKRVVRKKRGGLRLGCLLCMLLAMAALVVAAILIFRPVADEDEPAAGTGDALWDGGWYDDELGRIQGDRALVKGMKAFEKKTGVRPYLTILGGVAPQDLAAFVREQHETLFGQGDHLLVVYDEWGDSTYYLSARTGALSAVSQGEIALLLSCIEQAYADPANGSYAEAFGAGFTEGARQISEGRKTESGSAGLLLGLGIMLVVLSVVLILFSRKRGGQEDE